MLFQRNNDSLSKILRATYLQNILNSYKPNVGLLEFMSIWAETQKIGSSWAGSFLNEVCASGSYAKGTAIREGTDFDFFFSIKSQCPNSLKEIYDSLFSFLDQQGLNPRKQNVSIGLNLQGKQIDLVPGKQQNALSHDHALYKFKLNSWTKTNIKTHIHLIRSSGKADTIRLLKIWRKCQKLEFTSFYLELMVLEALKRPFAFFKPDIDAEFLTVLEFIAQNIEGKTIEDPANSANFLSNDLFQTEKKLIADKAGDSVNKIRAGKVSEIIW